MKQLRKWLLGGPYPGMGTGDPDLYKAFCWRFWHLTTANGGHIGVVLPRSAVAAKGSTKFRKTIFNQSSCADVTILRNRRGWVFDDIAHQYTIALLCLVRDKREKTSISLRGPYTCKDGFNKGIQSPEIQLNLRDVLKWNDTASLPLLPDSNTLSVFAQIRKAPRLDLNVNARRGG